MLKKAASGVLAIVPCSRTESTLRAPKWLRPCWADFFEHSFPLMMSVSVRGGMGHRLEIFNGPLTETSTSYSLSTFNWLKGIITLTYCKKNGTHLGSGLFWAVISWVQI